jgi:hypothetical protein
MHYQGYRWALAVWRKEEDDFVDLSVSLAESRQWDGTADDDGSSKGMTVISGIVTTGGRILSGFAPFNYSDRVWTDDADELRDRLRSLTEVNSVRIVEFVSKVLSSKLHCD